MNLPKFNMRSVRGLFSYTLNGSKLSEYLVGEPPDSE